MGKAVTPTRCAHSFFFLTPCWQKKIKGTKTPHIQNILEVYKCLSDTHLSDNLLQGFKIPNSCFLFFPQNQKGNFILFCNHAIHDFEIILRISLIYY